jgi:hypothetical protein
VRYWNQNENEVWNEPTRAHNILGDDHAVAAGRRMMFRPRAESQSLR